MNLSLDMLSVLASLTMNDIKNALPSVFSHAEKHSCAKLEDAVYHLPQEQQDLLAQATHAKKCRTITDLDKDVFLWPVSDECWRECVSKFIDSMGNDATATSICAVCAGQFFNKEICTVKVSNLQAKKKCSPMTSHPAHILTEGMLLHRSDPACIQMPKDIHLQLFVLLAHPCCNKTRHLLCCWQMRCGLEMSL